MLEMAPGYNPIQKMMEAETMAERARQLPTFLIGLGAIAGGGKKPSKMAIPYRGKMKTQYSRSLSQPIKKVKKFVEDWFTSSESKKKAKDIILGDKYWTSGTAHLEGGRFSAKIPGTEGPPATKGAFGDPIEMVTERIEEMRKADLPDILRYEQLEGIGGHWMPPPKGTLYEKKFPSEEWIGYGITKSFPATTKRLGRIAASQTHSPVTAQGQSILAHEFTHMAEGGWYHNELNNIISPHIKYSKWIKDPSRSKAREYLSEPREVLARVMQLRYDYFKRLGVSGPPSKRKSAPSEFAYKFQNVGDDFFKFLEQKEMKPKYYTELKYIFNNDNLKKMVNTLPAAAALLLGESVIRKDNATSK
tara:strand:- start:50 stop:1132 length:1083 start_codon:yes stop_codon:yes gene_type:complete